MNKPSVRVACSALLIAGPLVAASPAHAVTSCTVNGVPVSAPVVTGTPRSDFISCSDVDETDTVNALGGDDRIVLTGRIAGDVLGGDGRDKFRITQTADVTLLGHVNGEAGRDAFDIRGVVSAGQIAGGPDRDVLAVHSGASVLPSGILRGDGQNDVITALPGSRVDGSVQGGDGNDALKILTTLQDGIVLGESGNDNISATVNNGMVDGGSDVDKCRVQSGTAPTNCEL